MSAPLPTLPDYGGASTISILPSITWGTPSQVLPDDVVSADRVVVLVIDSLGWIQLQDYKEHAPTLAAFAGGPATTTAPSTTAVALTSISTALRPASTALSAIAFPSAGES